MGQSLRKGFSSMLTWNTSAGIIRPNTDNFYLPTALKHWMLFVSWIVGQVMEFINLYMKYLILISPD